MELLGHKPIVGGRLTQPPGIEATRATAEPGKSGGGKRGRGGRT
jgi:hypothetical protein